MTVSRRHEAGGRFRAGRDQEGAAVARKESVKDDACSKSAALPEKSQICDRVSTTLRRFLTTSRSRELVFRQFGYRLTNRSAASVIHGWSPVANAAPGAFAAECWNNLCGSHRICSAAVPFLETFG